MTTLLLENLEEPREVCANSKSFFYIFLKKTFKLGWPLGGFQVGFGAKTDVSLK